MRKNISRLLVLALALTTCLLLTSAASAEAREVKLTILGTSDIHAQLYGFAYEDSKETANNGWARLATYIKQVREENPNVILMDNGDTYQGTILSDDVYNKRPAEGIHPISQTLNELGYDAFTLGNHEFNFGIELIARMYEELDMAVLSANSFVKETGENLVDAYTVIERDDLKIGIIGLTTPNIPRWDGEKVDSLEFESMAETARAVADILIEEEKVDLILISAHAGMTAEYDLDNESDGAAKILEMVPEAAAMLVGHYHIVVKDQVGETVVGAPRNLGRDIVRFDLTVQIADDGAVTVTDKAVDVIDMAETTPDEEYRALIQYAHDATIAFIEGGEGSAAGETGGVFGQASADFQPKEEIIGIPEGKLRDTAVIDLINNVQLAVSGADVSAAALFSDKSDILAGDIKYSTIFGIYKYDNTLYTVDVTGAELKAFMEWSAEHYNTWQPGDLNISFNADIPGYRYDMFQGVDYKIDLSQPAGSRIVDVMFKGEPLKDDQVLKLAVNNYRYSSGLKANNLAAGTRDWESPRSVRDYLVEYVLEQGTVDPVVDNNWEITGVDLSHPLRDKVIALVNEGKIEVPYSEALNINKLLEDGIIDEEGNLLVEAEKPAA